MAQKQEKLGRDHNQIRTTVVTTPEQLLHAFAVRAVCIMEETGLSAMQTYDGNDYQATHILVYADQEPIGTARIRWFRDFAKMERSCFRPAWRNPRVLKASADFIFDHIARKGYTRVITHAEPKYARLWRTMLGFKGVEGKPPLVFSGREQPFLELVKELAPREDAITPASEAAVLTRIEGYWDAPSAYEAANR